MSLICPKCQTENKNNATFCSNCGNTLDKEKDYKRYDGIGGWLILISIGIVFAPLWAIGNINAFNDFKSNEELLRAMPNVILQINQGLFIHYIQLAITVVMIFLFFKHKKIFPKAFIGLLVFNIILVIIDASLLKSIFSGYDNMQDKLNFEIFKDIFKTILLAIIWIPYMLISKRVKGTFTK